MSLEFLTFVNMTFAVVSWGMAIATIVLFIMKREPTVKTKKKNKRKRKPTPIIIEESYGFFEKNATYIVFALIIIGAIIRLYNLGINPHGLHQDEASIGYDVFAIAKYGLDRNGDYNTFYPIAWGAGHTPFIYWITVPFVKIMGLSVFSYRLPNALLGILALYPFYLLVKTTTSIKTGLVALLLLVVNPWHITVSRWALDASPFPNLFIIATCLFALAVVHGKTWLYLSCSAVFALSLYSYAAGFVVVPLFLLIVVAYLLYHKKISLSQVFYSALTFVVISIPLAIFLAINVFDLEPIVLPFITFQKFTVMRSTSVFIPFGTDFWRSFAGNLRVVLGIVFNQLYFPWESGSGHNELWQNSTPYFSTLYLFSSPFIILGLIQLGRKLRTFSLEIMHLAWFVAAFVYCLMIFVFIHRIGIIFPAMILLMVYGVMFMYTQYKHLASAAVVMAIISFVAFTGYYFTQYDNDNSMNFFDSFGEAIIEANSVEEGQIFASTDLVNGPFILTMFYTQIPPQEFLDTVEYFDDKAEFRHAKKFGRFLFGPLQNRPDVQTYVVHNSQLDAFNPEQYTFSSYKNFTVVHKK